MHIRALDALNQFKIEIDSLVRKMRKDVADISDTSSSLLLMIESSRGTTQAQAQQQTAPQLNQRSTLEVSIDALLGELSEIRADNGIAPQNNQANQLDLLQQNSSVHFNVLEGHSSVHHEESSSIPLQLPAESASELAYENVQLLEEDADVIAVGDDSSLLPREDTAALQEIRPEYDFAQVSQVIADAEPEVPKETEEEALQRKTDMYMKALMSIKAQNLAQTIRAGMKGKRVYAGSQVDLNSLLVEERDSFIEKPPQVSKAYCFSQSSQDDQLRRRDSKRLRKTNSGSSHVMARLTQLRLGRDQSSGTLSLTLSKDSSMCSATNVKRVFMGSRAAANERLMKLQKRLFKNKQSLVAKKLKFITNAD